MYLKTERVYTPETSCMNRTSLHIKKLCIKQLCSLKVGDFATAFRELRETGSRWEVPVGYISRNACCMNVSISQFNFIASYNGQYFTKWIKYQNLATTCKTSFDHMKPYLENASDKADKELKFALSGYLYLNTLKI